MSPTSDGLHRTELLIDRSRNHPKGVAFEYEVLE
jgi:hypothetical protein